MYGHFISNKLGYFKNLFNYYYYIIYYLFLTYITAYKTL